MKKGNLRVTFISVITIIATIDNNFMLNHVKKNKKRGERMRKNLVCLVALILLTGIITAQGTQDSDVSATIANIAPNITEVASGWSTDPTFCDTTTVNSIWFNVTDNNGYLDLDDATAVINLSNGGVTRTIDGACSAADHGATWINYTCDVTLNYWDLPAAWVITAYVADDSALDDTDATETFTYNSGTNLNVTSAIAFGSVSVGSSDNYMTTEAYTLENCGNTLLASNITGANISDGSDHYLLASYFTVMDEDGPETDMALALTTKNFTSPIAISTGASSLWNLNFSLDIPLGQAIGTYNVGSFQWTPRVST